MTIRKHIHEVIESSEEDNWKGRWFDTFMILLIATNVVAVVLETVQELAIVHGPFFHAFDMISVIVFTIEYALRLWVVVEGGDERFHHPVNGRFRYAITPLALIDLVAIAPFYLSWFIPFDLRFMRVFRLLRLLKLTRYSPALQTLGAAVHTQRRALAAAFVVIVILLVFASSIIYLLEHETQPEAFASIPHAMWWGLATLTTVGYGDVTPISVGGRIFGGLIMVLGIGMFALPAGILATAFANEVRKREFVVTWRMVASVPLFSHLDAMRIAEIVDLLEIRVLPPRYTVFEKGEHAEAMYFISVGEVEVQTLPQPHRLGSGEFFGEIALLKEMPRTATVDTITECQLLVLYVESFKRLLLTDPSLREVLLKTSEERLREIEQGSGDSPTN